MPIQITIALVISKPGPLFNGLQSLLRTIPQIEIIAESQNPSVLLKMGTEMYPELILLDASILNDTTWSAISKIKTERPLTKIIVLIENDPQKLKVQHAGADLLLPNGFPAAKLVALIEDLLIQNTPEELPASLIGEEDNERPKTISR
jgi:DNA-binding NarL/FixJ family response regulator